MTGAGGDLVTPSVIANQDDYNPVRRTRTFSIGDQVSVQASIDRSGELAAFVLSVSGGGFSAAARQLGVTPSAVAKTVSRLENRLGVKLLHRTTRRLHLTGEGDHFYRRAQHILAQIEEAELEVASAALAPRGHLRLYSGSAIGLHHLTPLLPEFCRRYPDVALEITINERSIAQARVDIDEGADLMLRAGAVDRLAADGSLVARKLCDVERTICASPAYLAAHGAPRMPQDLAQHECLRLVDNPELASWPFRTADGVRSIQVSGHHTANNAETLLQMALAGMGIVRLVDPMVSEPLARGELVALLQDSHHLDPVPMQILMPRDKHRLPKVRVMVDFLVEKFESPPWLRPSPAVGPRR